MSLYLTSLENEVFDAKLYCSNINVCAQNDSLSRSSIQKLLQSTRDSEAAESQALAIITDTAYVNTVKSSCGDLMTTASVIPSVVEQSPEAIIADNALGSQISAAASSIDKVAEAAASATDPVSAASALSQITAAMDSSKSSSMPSADSLLKTLGGIDTESITDTAKVAANMYIKQQTCGIADLDDAELSFDIIDKGSKGIAESALTALTTGDFTKINSLTSTPSDNALLAAYGGTAELQKSAYRAATQAEIDTTKTASINLAKQSIESFGDGVVTNLNNGTLTPNVLLDNFDANGEALGEAIAGYVGAAVADEPSANPCASQAVTNYSLGCAALVSTANKICNGANLLLSKAASFADQAENIIANGPELVIAMSESAIQNIANTAFMALRNAGKTNCNIHLALNVAENTIGSAQKLSVAGQAVLAQADRAQGAIGNLINTCKHADDLVEKGKQLVKNHPIVKVASEGLKFKASDMKSYDMLTNTGIKFARTVMGTERQNMLSSANKAMNKVSSYKELTTTRKTYSTTTTERNRYNLYGLNRFFLNDTSDD